MGIAERKERDKQELRDRILKAAKEVFLGEGFEKTSIRRIAEKIEYSPGTIYVYFRDKDEILLELHVQAFGELFRVLEQSAHIQHPLERLKAIGRAYIKFGLENPDLYNLMFIMEAPMKALKEGCSWEEGFKTFNILREVVERGISQGVVKGDNPDLVSVSLWSSVHGLISLFIRERFQMIPPDQVEPMIFACAEDMAERFRR